MRLMFVARASMASGLLLAVGPGLGTSVAAQALPTDAALQAFGRLHVVATSPRCTHCHSPYAFPIQNDPLTGREIPHAMNITRRLPTLGAKCTACHQSKNFDVPHLPPGTTREWQLPEVGMAITRATKPGELCALWKDRKRNGNRSLDEMLAHVSTDPLVTWSWSPGPGRTPAPGSHALFVHDFKTWASAGGPCPSP